MAEVNVSQIIVSGLQTECQTGKKSVFNISGAQLSELADGMSYGLVGPTKPDVMTNYETEDHSVEAYFVPLVPGDYKLTVRYRGRHVTGSPFKIKITGEKVSVANLLSKITVHGRGSELGKPFTMNEFVVDCSRVKPVIGGLKVHVKGPERSSAQLSIKDNKNGTYKILYKPTSTGNYIMNVKIADEHIPGSPFTIRVTEFLS